MLHYALCDASGAVAAVGTCSPDDLILQLPPEGGSRIVVAEADAPAIGAAMDRWRLVDGMLVQAAPVLTLDMARANAKRAAEAQRDTRLAAGMPWVGQVLQIDDASQARLLAGKAMADAGTLPAGFAWRMMDNSALPLGAAGMQAMAEAAGAYVYALRAHYWSLVDAIAAATDAEAVAAIDVTAGWPD